MDEQKVTITLTLERFTQLMELETRVNILVERIDHDEYMNVEELLWALGTENSVEIAQKMRDEKEKERVRRNESEDQ
jgi:hypothetical protein